MDRPTVVTLYDATAGAEVAPRGRLSAPRTETVTVSLLPGADEGVEGDGDEEQGQVEVRDVEEAHRVDVAEVVGRPRCGPQPVRLDEEDRSEDHGGDRYAGLVAATGHSSRDVATVAQV